MQETFDGVREFQLNKLNRDEVHYLLARMTTYVDQESGAPSSFLDYVPQSNKRPYDIEASWRNPVPFMFAEDDRYRQLSLGNLTLAKSDRIKGQRGPNLLHLSLQEECYQENSGFLAYVQRSKLPFRPYSEFKKEDIESRQELYRLICEQLWSPTRLDEELM